MKVQHNAPWRRHHDPPDRSLTAATIWYPENLSELLAICDDPPGGLRANGSHYALSGAAISDDAFIETNDPANVQPAMARSLDDVLARCISQPLLDHLANSPPDHYPVLVEGGKRIYQLYSELDYPKAIMEPSVAHKIKAINGREDYFRRWALPTMGSAGQQTVVGALTTGTHGGDIELPPICDAVQAIHLVVDGGRHYWIERERGWTKRPPRVLGNIPVVDADAIEAEYSAAAVGTKIEVIRDDELFNAVLVSAGRFGVIYSVVIAVVPQFALRQRTDLSHKFLGDDDAPLLWQEVRSQIQGRNNRQLWAIPGRPPIHFLGIVVCLSPLHDGDSNRVAVQRRWIAADLEAGVAERRGDPGDPWVVDPRTQSIVFPRAGNAKAFGLHPYPSMIEVACSADSLLAGLLAGIADQLARFVESNGAVVGAGILAVGALGGGGLVLMIPQLAIVLFALRAFIEEFDFDDATVADVMEGARKAVMGVSEVTGLPAPTFVWRLLTDMLFTAMLTDEEEIEGVSYAVMDSHDYRDRNCFVDVDSLEVFFNTDDSRLLAYIDALINFEKAQQAEGRSFFGIVGIRFMRGTEATIGPQRWPYTASAEVAGLNGVEGTAELMHYASTLARDLGVGGFLHWGQRNDTDAAWLSRTLHASGDLARWQRQLARLTNDGGLGHFSNAQTRQWGLEVP